MFFFSETGSDQVLGKYVTLFSVMVFLTNSLSMKKEHVVFVIHSFY